MAASRKRPSTELIDLPSSTADSSVSYIGLARHYRPQTFSDVVGQKPVVQTLRKAIESGRWASAYLFIGGRGLGKTTIARILAKGILCEKGPTPQPCGACDACREITASRHIDVLEIDAASNTGVDNVRDTIIQAVSTSPVRGRAKIFIIDEVHMLSMSAFNALLKTIEEPPPHVIFIMATTDGHKVPATIRSRCQRFDFRPITREELGARLAKIAKEEGINLDVKAIDVICDYAEGGVRDALSALDLARAFAGDHITAEATEEALGVIPSSAIESLLEFIAAADPAGAQSRFASMLADGGDPSEILRGLLQAFRKLLIAQVQGRGATPDESMSRGRIIRSLEAIMVSADRARFSRHPRLEAEVLICRLAGMSAEEVTLRDIYSRLIELEEGGGVHSLTTLLKPSTTAADSAAVPVDVVPQEKKTPLCKPPASADGFSHERLTAELEKISALAAALVKDARVELGEGNRVTLWFTQPGLFERYRSEIKVQVAVASTLEGLLGKRIAIDAKLVESSPRHPEENFGGDKGGDTKSSGISITKGAKNAKAASNVSSGAETKPSEAVDPEIERIRKLFGAEIVEVIK